MLLFCWFDHFLDSGAEFCQIFRWFSGKFKISKRHSEINWPLAWMHNLKFKSWMEFWGGIQAMETMLFTIDHINKQPWWIKNITLGKYISVFRSMMGLKVRKIQNVNMKSSHCPKYERNFLKNSEKFEKFCTEFFKYFRSYFGHCDYFISTFWNFLTFRRLCM